MLSFNRYTQHKTPILCCRIRFQILYTSTSTLPALGSLNAPLQNLTLLSFEQSLTYVKKATLKVLMKFNSTLLHLKIRYQPLLQRIEDDAFIWTPNLITLNLDINSINYIEKYAFNGLVTLQELNPYNAKV